jgi:hypothetical protein
VSKEELKGVAFSFQKDKGSGPDGWTIEFFENFYKFLEEDILAVVEESRS